MGYSMALCLLAPRFAINCSENQSCRQYRIRSGCRAHQIRNARGTIAHQSDRIPVAASNGNWRATIAAPLGQSRRRATAELSRVRIDNRAEVVSERASQLYEYHPREPCKAQLKGRELPSLIRA